MYVYDEYDQTIVDQRVTQFRGQTERFLAGKLSEASFQLHRRMDSKRFFPGSVILHPRA